MSGPDGLEERTADYEETFERDLDDADVREQLADEDVTLTTLVPTRCIVHGHSFHPRTHHCRFCGEYWSLLDIASDRLRSRCLETSP